MFMSASSAAGMDLFSSGVQCISDYKLSIPWGRMLSTAARTLLGTSASHIRMPGQDLAPPLLVQPPADRPWKAAEGPTDLSTREKLIEFQTPSFGLVQALDVVGIGAAKTARIGSLSNKVKMHK